MTSNNLQEPLQTFPSVLNHIITESIGKHFPWKRWYCDSGALAFQDVSEVLEVGVSPAHDGMLKLEGGDVCAADDFIGSEHVTGSSVGLRVADLLRKKRVCLAFRAFAVIDDSSRRMWKQSSPQSRGSSREVRRAPQRFAAATQELPALWTVVYMPDVVVFDKC